MNIFKNIKFVFFTILLVFLLRAEAQTYRKQLETIGVVLPYDKDLARTIYDNMPKEYKTNALKERSCYFSTISANEYIEDLYQQDYYSGWKEFEDYLNQVFRNILPSYIANNQMLRVRVIKDGYFNATMSSAGIMNLNIGLFDNIQNEATLAGIMAHELSHYLLFHSIKSYLSYERGEFNSFFSLSEKLLNRYTAKQEYQADSMAAVLINQSAYSLQGLIQGFDYLSLLDRKRESLQSKKIDYNDDSHPDPILRKQKLMEYIAKYSNKKGDLFVVSNELLLNLKRRAKMEILDCLLSQFEYDDCTEKAFKYHILDPTNPTYIEYITESIRRNCYGQTELWTKNFITYRYYDCKEKDIYKSPTKETLFKKLNPNFLSLNEDEIETMKASFYWDGVERFATNEEAFNYFVKIGNKLKDPEILLTNALSFTRDTTSRNYYLRKYLNNSNITFPEYARLLLKDSLVYSLPSKKLVVLLNIDSYIRVGQNEIEFSSLSFDTSNMAKQILDGLKSTNDSANYLLLPDLMYKDIEKYNMLKQIMISSFGHNIFFGEPVYPQIHNPGYWYLFKDLGINQIEFIIFSYFGNENKVNNPEQYWQYATCTVPELINKTCRFKVMDIALSQISMSSGKKKDSYYFKNDLDLPNNACVDEIINNINSHRAIFKKGNALIK